LEAVFERRIKEFAAKGGLEKLEIVLFASASRRGGRKGGLGGIPPAEPVNEISSDIFKYTPPVGKRSVWLARYAGSPPDFEAEI